MVKAVCAVPDRRRNQLGIIRDIGHQVIIIVGHVLCRTADRGEATGGRRRPAKILTFNLQTILPLVMRSGTIVTGQTIDFQLTGNKTAYYFFRFFEILKFPHTPARHLSAEKPQKPLVAYTHLPRRECPRPLPVRNRYLCACGRINKYPPLARSPGRYVCISGIKMPPRFYHIIVMAQTAGLAR